jgi:hypothetical protein
MARMVRRRSTLTIACLLLCSLAVAPASARADADPPSDILLVQNVFFPYQPIVSTNLQHALTKLTTQTQHSGFPIKVALVDTATDLGGVPALFGQPQRYSAFLASEIAFNGRQLVLVVMPAGIGTTNIPHADALAGLTVDASHGSDGLARTAIAAVVRLANANGHPVKAPSVLGGSGSSSGVSPLIAFGTPVALVIVAALLAGLARRRRREEDHLDEDLDESGAEQAAEPSKEPAESAQPDEHRATLEAEDASPGAVDEGSGKRTV